MPATVDTLGHLLTLKVTAANAQNREQVDALTQTVQEATGANVPLAYVEQGCTGQGVWDELAAVKPRRGSCCRRAGGWWSACLDGPRGFVAWREITNGWPPP